MPAAYAHLIFGRRAASILPEGRGKEIVRAYPQLFEIGLQGPDILFFYRPLTHAPLNRLGHSLHEETGWNILTRPVCREAEGATLAYLLGFICHYALDSECHTIVEYHIGRSGRGHSDLETDLERFLMLRDGLDPTKTAAAGYMRATPANAAAIAPVYGAQPEKIKRALTTMKLVGRILTPSSPLKHTLLTKIGRAMGEGSVISELTMDRMPDPVYEASDRELATQLELAVPVAVALMENFLAWQRGEEELSRRFQKTFSFDEEELARRKERDHRV